MNPSMHSSCRRLIALGLMLLAAGAFAADVSYQVGALQGSLQSLLGVNAGPLPAGTAGNANLTTQYQQAGVNLIRSHDFYGPLDMATMYPDHTKSPTLSSSFNFSTPPSGSVYSSDAVFSAIQQGGFELYFRLGDSWNNVKVPASDAARANWAQAAVQVLRHYRSGQWGGFNSNFRYVEIWNEPDNQQFWPTPYTQEEFFKLYEAAATAIRAAFPEIRIGGPGFAPSGALAPEGQAFTRAFLDYVKAHDLPFDFLSWHVYSATPDDYNTVASFYRSELSQRGLNQVENHISEWNTPNTTNSNTALEYRTKAKGATLLCAAWINLQEQGVSQSLFYRGTDPSMDAPSWYGLFYADGSAKKIAQVFALWSEMAAAGHRPVLTGSGSPGSLKALAAQAGNGAILMLVANPGTQSKRWTLTFANSRRWSEFTPTLKTVSDNSSAVQTTTPASAEIDIAPGTTQLLRLEPNGSSTARGSNAPVLMLLLE